MANSVQGDTVTYQGRRYRLIETTTTSYIFTDGLKRWNVAKTEFEQEIVIPDVDVPTKLSELESDSDHRTVTDVEKDYWNNKPEDIDDLTDTTGQLRGVRLFVITDGDPTPSDAQNGDVLIVKPV